MISLLLDTATERGLVALCQGTQVLKEIQLPFGLQNSKVLFLELDRLFKETHIAKQSLELIVCGQGPGSYTGMRVAAAAAQSLAYALNIPLIGVPTTSGLVSEQEGVFAAVIDAKISGVYFQKGQRTKQEIHFSSEPEIVSLEQLPHKLDGVSSIITPKKETLISKIAGDFVWEEKSLCPKTMISHALKKPIDRFNLLYLRKTQAEIERLSK